MKSILFVWFILTAFSGLYAQQQNRKKAPPGKKVQPVPSAGVPKKAVLYEEILRLRLHLDEKNNIPLNFRPTESKANSGAMKNNSGKKFPLVNGPVYGLIEAFSQDKIKGYNPDTLTKELPYIQLYERVQRIVAEREGDTLTTAQARNGGGVPYPHPAYVTPINEITVFEPMMDLMVRYYIDPVTSGRRLEIQYVILYHADAIDNKIPAVAFKYEDVKDLIFAKMMIPNRHNDAEIKSVKDFFEKHKYTGVIIKRSGQPVQNLHHARQLPERYINREEEMWQR